jgi:hypothetical protein
MERLATVINNGHEDVICLEARCADSGQHILCSDHASGHSYYFGNQLPGLHAPNLPCYSKLWPRKISLNFASSRIQCGPKSVSGSGAWFVCSA